MTARTHLQIRLTWAEAVAATSLDLQDRGVPGEVAFQRALDQHREHDPLVADRVCRGKRRFGRIQHRVLEFLREQADPVSASQIAIAALAEQHSGRRMVRQALLTLSNLGFVEVVSHREVGKTIEQLWAVVPG